MTGRLSFAGQMAIVLAIALLAAQSVNFVLLLQAKKREQLARDTAVVERFVDGLDNLDRFQKFMERRHRGRDERRPGPEGGMDVPPPEGAAPNRFDEPRRDDFPFRGPFRETHAPLDEGERDTVLTVRLIEALTAAGYPADGARVARADWEGSFSGRGEAPPIRRVLIISVPQQDGDWINFTWPIRPEERLQVTPLIIQTILIYLGLLAAVLLVTARLSRPLARLTQEADTLTLEGEASPLPLEGPKDIRRLTAAFERMRTRLGRAFKEKDVMLGALGHDLRTPLTSLRIRAEQVDNPKLREGMTTTIEELSALLDDILTLARDGAAKADRELIYVPVLLSSLADELGDGKGEVRLGRVEELSVSCMPALLRRALRNLIENGLRYGGAVTLNAHMDGDDIVLAVEDEGPGVPEGELAALREPFVRGESSRNRQTGGAGLGLAIAEGAARAHDGRLRLENKKEGGFRAALVLPVEQA